MSQQQPEITREFIVEKVLPFTNPNLFEKDNDLTHYKLEDHAKNSDPNEKWRMVNLTHNGEIVAQFSENNINIKLELYRKHLEELEKDNTVNDEISIKLEEYKNTLIGKGVSEEDIATKLAVYKMVLEDQI